ncbi:MAG: hypothetical protein EOM25_07600, partial [Deltaproteobacteria bacterium]|nr:hypothetical protein [Deltaproteobacteria bacterium]
MNHPSSLTLSHLRRLCPDWAVGVAGRGILLHHLQTILRSSLNGELSTLTWEIAHWRWQLLPWDRQAASLCSSLAPKAGKSFSPVTSPASTARVDEFIETIQAISFGDMETVVRLWKNHPQGVDLDPAWAGEVCLFALQRGNLDLADMVLETSGLAPEHPVLLQLGALRSLCFDSTDLAIGHIDRLT